MMSNRLRSIPKALLWLTLALLFPRVRSEVVVTVQIAGGVELVNSYLGWEDFQSGTIATQLVASGQEGTLVALCSDRGRVISLRNVHGRYYLDEFGSFAEYVIGRYTSRTIAGRRHIPAIRGLATDGTRYWTQSYTSGTAHILTYDNQQNLITGVASEDLELGWPLDVAGEVAYSGGEVHLVYSDRMIVYGTLKDYKENLPANLISLPPSLGTLVAISEESGDVDPLAHFNTNISVQDSGLTQLVPVAGYMNGVFPSSVPGIGGWQVVNAFTNLTFVEPMQVLGDPSRPGNLLVVGLTGQIWRVPNDPAAPANSKQLVLDISGQVERIDNDHGLYRIELHPQFGNRRVRNGSYLYAIYMHPRPDLPGYVSGYTKYWRLSRFTMNLETGIVDPRSEVILINQYCPGIWHNGGGMVFGKDGYLYVSVGDNERPDETTQVLDGGFRSGVLRIDVDMNPLRSHPIRRQPTSAEVPAGWPASFSANYFVPNDNPWMSPDGARLEEFYAIGLRNPYTMTQDASTSQVWIGDVGSVISEEINLLDQPGLNFQWPFREGNTLTGTAPPAGLFGIERGPELVYGHADGAAILVGFVYRAAAYEAELGGKLLLSDNTSGTIWTFDAATRQGKVEIANAGSGGGINLGVVNLCAGPNGEVFIPFQTGRGAADGLIKRLVPASVTPQPPSLLSETHAFRDLPSLTPHSAFIPYSPASPLWSDGADKFRWIAVPNDGLSSSSWAKISIASENWLFPAGTVIMKHFEMPLDERDPGRRKRLETRFIVCLENGGKYGVTYRWLDDGSDAVLATGRSTLNYSLATQSGALVARQWTVPSRADCLYCHNSASGQALGLKAHQLNHDFTYPATKRTRNQMATLGYLGLISPAPSLRDLAGLLKAHDLRDPTAPLEHRVRSYLDANCSHCHQPGGGGSGFDARLYQPLVTQSLINGVIKGHFSFVPEGKLVSPGNRGASAVSHRAASDLEGVAMPPIGRSVVDALAVEEMAHWIRSLHPEDFVNSQAPTGRYLRLRALSEVNGQPWTAIAELRIIGSDGAAYPQSGMVVSAVSSANAGNAGVLAIDGDNQSLWVSEWAPEPQEHPHTITVDLGSPKPIGGFEYQPREDGSENGRIARWEAEISLDGESWQPFLAGTFPNSGLLQRRHLGNGSLWPVRPQIGVPGEVVTGDFEVVITLDADVTDFVLADLDDAVIHGQATALRGAGHYYTATIHPTGGPVTIRLKKNVMGNGSSAASNSVTVGYREEASTLSARLLTAAESDGQARVILNIDQPLAAPASVRVFTRSGTALAGQDFAAFDQTLAIPAEVASVEVKLPLIKHGNSVDGKLFYLELEPGDGLAVSRTELEIPIQGDDTGVSPDSDADGLPDFWELAYFGDLSQTADGDPDGDLSGNLMEFLLGTVPDVPGAYQGITSLEFAAGGVTVTWASVPGKNYELYISADMTSWTRQTGGSIPATGPYTSARITLPAGRYDAQFFVKVVPKD